MNFKKVVALSICAAMVAGMSASTVMAADLPDQFKDLKANEAYEFPMMVKSFQSTYWDAAQEGMKMAADELGVIQHRDRTVSPISLTRLTWLTQQSLPTRLD